MAIMERLYHGIDNSIIMTKAKQPARAVLRKNKLITLLLLSALATLAAAFAELSSAPNDDQDRPNDADDRAREPAEVIQKERQTDQDNGDRTYHVMTALARAACLGSFVRIHDVLMITSL